MKMKKAFTLAEIMIVLTIIGVLTMILLPIANHSRPDENVMKFKKADTTFKNVIHELVTSNKYFCNGWLAKKADCTTTLHTGTGRIAYFCTAFADLLSAKKVNCPTTQKGSAGLKGARLLSNEDVCDVFTGTKVVRTVTPETILATKKYFDDICNERQSDMGEEIVTSDNIIYFQATTVGFGSNQCASGGDPLIFSDPNVSPANYADQNGFDIVYKAYCIDIDGIGKGEKPFGYGIRGDGKILPGARADEWLEKGFQKGSNEN